MTISAQQFRNHIGHHYNRIQPQPCVPVHHHKPPRSAVATNIARVTQHAGFDIERQGGNPTPHASIKCSTAKTVFTILACGAMATAAGFIIRDLLPENHGAEIDAGRFIKTDHFEQGEMAYFTDQRVEYTVKKGYDGYLLDHEKLAPKVAQRG